MATSFQLFPAYGFDPLSAFRGSTLGETHCNPHGPHGIPPRSKTFGGDEDPKPHD